VTGTGSPEFWDGALSRAAPWLRAGFLQEALLVAALALVLCIRTRVRGRHWVLALIVLVGLFSAGQGLLGGGGPGLYRVPRAPSGLLSQLTDEQRVLFFETRGWNKLMGMGLNNLGGYDPSISNRMNLFANVSTYGEQGLDAGKTWMLWPTGRNHRPSRLWDLASVRYAVVSRTGWFGKAGWHVKAQEENWSLAENPRAAPGAFCPKNVRPAAGPREAARLMLDSASPAAELAFVESGHGEWKTSGRCRAGRVAAGPGYQRFDVESDSGETLVVAGQHYPGWECLVDGRGSRLAPANLISMACAVPAGRHDVVFRYNPVTFYVGLTLSIVMLVILAALFLLVRRRKEHA